MALRNDLVSWYRLSPSIKSIAPNRLGEKVLNNCVERVLRNDTRRDRVSDRANPWRSLGEDHARRANRRSIANIRPDCSGGFHCDFGWNGACDSVLRRSLARVAFLDGMGRCSSKCSEHGTKLDHAVKSGTQALGSDHDRHVRSGCCGLVFLALNSTRFVSIKLARVPS